jgi:RNA polymerase primary sigma factor
MSQSTATETVARRATSDSEPDLVGQYLAQIGATRLLTAADEVELAKRIEAGVYAQAVLDGKLPRRRPRTEERRRELEEIARDGQSAKDHMVRANLRLVVSVARKLSNRGLPFLDVIQEGNLGLIRAVEKFDYAKGFKFSTYATWWIRQAIQRGLAEQTHTIRLPVHVSETVSKIHRVDRDLQRLLGRDPTVEEIAAEAGLTPERVTELRKASRDPLSLETPIGEDGETRIGELVQDDDVISAIDVVEHHALGESLRATLATLPPRDAKVISMRYGLLDGHQHTLQDVADHLGLSRERVRQIERHALAALRKPERREALLDWAS